MRLKDTASFLIAKSRRIPHLCSIIDSYCNATAPCLRQLSYVVSYRLILHCNCALSSAVALRCLLLTLIALVSHQVRRTIRWQMTDLVLRSHKSTTGSVGFRMLHDETYTSLDGKITQDTASLLNYLKGNYSTSPSVERHSFQ